MVTVKYVCLVLRADDDGEGGTFALYSLLAKFMNIMPNRNPDDVVELKFERHKTGDLGKTSRGIRALIESSSFIKYLINILAVLGVCLVLADGVLTPAQSILGAIQGLNIVAPELQVNAIVGITCAILVLLFAIQPFGTSKLAVGFAPVIVIWLLFNFVFGIYNLAVFDYTVLKAFNPYYCGLWFKRNGREGWKSLGGLLLAFTGVEAMFADLGAFSRRAVQLSWLCFTFPCLLVAYIGQAAYISRNAGAYSNPFFSSVPPGMFWPSLVLSVLATIVASQAMITGAFAILSQAMALSYFPKISIIHTSDRFQGQIYIPLANWLLMIGTVVVTAVYNNTTSLGNAYGVCVVMVTFITTMFVSMVAIVVWKTPVLIVLVGFIFFGLLDGMYLSSALNKVPDGAWFTLLLAGVFACIMFLWRYGKTRQWAAERADRISASDLVKVAADGSLEMVGSKGHIPMGKLRGLGIFFDERGYLSPSAYTYFVLRFQAQHEAAFFVHMRQVAEPTVPQEQQFNISRAGVPHAYRIIIRHGYNDHVIGVDFAKTLVEQVRAFLGAEMAKTLTSSDSEAIRVSITNENEVLSAAMQKQVVYIMGKTELEPKDSATWKSLPRRMLLAAFIFIRDNIRSKAKAFGIPNDQLVEIGYIKEI